MNPIERKFKIDKIENYCQCHRCERCPFDSDNGCQAEIGRYTTDDEITEMAEQLDNMPPANDIEYMMDMIDRYCLFNVDKNCNNCVLYNEAPQEELNCSTDEPEEVKYLYNMIKDLVKI